MKSGADQRDENGGEQDGETESIGASKKGLGDATCKRPEAPRRSGKSLGCSSEECSVGPLSRGPGSRRVSAPHRSSPYTAFAMRFANISFLPVSINSRLDELRLRLVNFFADEWLDRLLHHTHVLRGGLSAGARVVDGVWQVAVFLVGEGTDACPLHTRTETCGSWSCCRELSRKLSDGRGLVSTYLPSAK